MHAATQPTPVELPGAFADAKHLELRFVHPSTSTVRPSLTVRGDGVARPLASTPAHTDWETLFDGITASRVNSLDVVLDRADVIPAVDACVTRLVERMPALTEMTLTCIGIPDARTAPLGIVLHECALQRGIAFSADFILDADADAFAVRDPQANAMAKVLGASRDLRTARVPVRWLLPVEKALVYRMEPLFSLARDEEIEPMLAPSWMASGGPSGPRAALDDLDRLFVRDFVDYRLLDEEKHLNPRARSEWYRALSRAMDDHGDFGAARKRTVAVVTAIATERESRWALHVEDRPTFGGAAGEWRTLVPDGSGNNRAARLFEQVREVAGVLVEGGFGLLQWIRFRIAEVARRHRHPETAPQFSTVLLIGAYGGDHIGDTAILGGVLLRIHQRYGTTKAILMSQRAAHTRHLVDMLDAPIPITVETYEPRTIRAHVPQVDAVVFAGGPLIDQPKQLVKHFYAASMARRLGKSFVMEGIGPGPFPRWPSEWVARRLVRMAQRISVRTATDAGSTIMNGLTPEFGRDPAFDYLATRSAGLNKLRQQDEEWIERLLEDTNGRLLIGMNLRPIRHFFTVGAPAGQRAEYTRLIEEQCEQQLAEGMRLFHRACAVPPCFIFFPMNAIQFGMSDLRSAYRLQRNLDPDVDFRVWQADASLDGAVALLRRLDVVITMRFHATIFALAQQRRVIGIDYRVGQQDKVGALLADLGQSENCRRIDELTSGWLCDRLSALSGTVDAKVDIA